MPIKTPASVVAEPEQSVHSAGRSRDASNTRQLLLNAARSRFAKDGYSATTVRDIANDAGVNVALINRYFESKEGLFETCLLEAAEGFKNPESDPTTLDRILITILQQVSDSPSGETSQRLLLMLRTSGDDQAERIRRSTFETFSRRIAVAAGGKPDAADFDDLILRAQMVLASIIGMVLLRSSTAIEPLTSATERELAGPMAELLQALLPR